MSNNNKREIIFIYLFIQNFKIKGLKKIIRLSTELESWSSKPILNKCDHRIFLLRGVLNWLYSGCNRRKDYAVSLKQCCRKFSENIDNTHQFNNDVCSLLLVQQRVQKLRVFLGISAHHIFPEMLNLNDSRKYEAPTEVLYPLFGEVQKCCVQFFGFFLSSFFDESMKYCRHYLKL